VVEIDGHDITNAIRSLTIQASATEMTTVTLELGFLSSTGFQADHVDVVIPQVIYDALVALGWTPPRPAKVTGL